MSQHQREVAQGWEGSPTRLARAGSTPQFDYKRLARMHNEEERIQPCWHPFQRGTCETARAHDLSILIAGD